MARPASSGRRMSPAHAKARAAMAGVYNARIEDVRAVSKPVLSHRVLTTFAAESAGMTSSGIVARLVQET